MLNRLGHLNRYVRMHVCALVPLLLCMGSRSAVAQNLVPNPSFEEYSTCPHGLSDFGGVVDWWGAFRSPDYFNGCDDDTMSVPYNAVGYQWPAEGSAYIGLITYTWHGHEFVQAELTEALVPGIPAHVSMKVSPGGFGIPRWCSPGLVSNNVGMRFSVNATTFNFDIETEFNSAVLHASDVLFDTEAWVILSTTFIPDSAYRFIQLGNFFADSLTSIAIIDPVAVLAWDDGLGPAYAFIDQVCVSQVDGVCEHAVAIGEHVLDPPIPCIVVAEELPLQALVRATNEVVVEARITDTSGRVVRSLGQREIETNSMLRVDHLPHGMYLLRFTTSGHTVVVSRFVKL